MKVIQRFCFLPYIFFLNTGILLIITNQLAAQEGNIIWYSRPAKNFNEALPIGNGRMGAMVYGGVISEFFSLNEQTVWSGGPDIRWNNPEAKKFLPLVREAAKAGNYHLADSLSRFMQGPYTESYMPMADLHLDHKVKGSVTEYKRSLDLNKAVCVTQFKSQGIMYQRTAFASFPARSIVLHYQASKKNSINFELRLSSKLRYQLRKEKDELILTGRCPKHVEPVYQWKIAPENAVIYDSDPNGEGMRFELRLKILQDGGQLLITDSSVQLNDATTATILITAATSFNGFNRSPGKEGKDPAIQAVQQMQLAAKESYKKLYELHLADYAPIFGRVKYRFGTVPPAVLPTDIRLKNLSKKPDPSLLALIVQYGRYLLIASSRPGGQPGNLKGIWNERLRPEYSSNWCIDHDAQMFYYAAETNNLSEFHGPFLELIRELAVNGVSTASINYGMRGWCAHHNTDIWRKSSPVGNWGEGNPHWATWNMSGPWLSGHFYEHFLFTGDTIFLRQEAWPVMKGAAMFCLDWLQENSTGELMSAPSVSPENTFITEKGDTAMISVNATSDIELMRDLFRNLLKAATLLHMEDSFTDSIKAAFHKLPAYPIGSAGQLLEWSNEWRAVDPSHRHLSHMYAVFPGSEISPLQTPALAEAAKKALSFRQKTNSSWGFAWKAACFARLGEGDSAWKTLSYQLKYVDAESKSSENNYGLYPNLFNSEVPYVILNGNTCITAVITEMLLQSHTGILQLLPALPTALPDGEVEGLCARGGFEMYLHWKNHELISGRILSRSGNDCRIILPDGMGIFLQNKIILPYQQAGKIVQFKTEKGKSYQIKALNN